MTVQLGSVCISDNGCEGSRKSSGNMSSPGGREIRTLHTHHKHSLTIMCLSLLYRGLNLPPPPLTLQRAQSPPLLYRGLNPPLLYRGLNPPLTLQRAQSLPPPPPPSPSLSHCPPKVRRTKINYSVYSSCNSASLVETHPRVQACTRGCGSARLYTKVPRALYDCACV